MKKRATWSQIVCWIAAGLDAAAAALLTWPRYGVLAYGMDAESITPLLQSLSGIAAALMWGWTALLLVASFKRSMRLETLILTIIPVMAGLLYNTFLDSDPRLLRADWSLWLMMIFQSLVVVLLITGIIAFWREGKAPKSGKPDLSTVVLDPDSADAPTPAPAQPAASAAEPNRTLITSQPKARSATPPKPTPNAVPLSPEAQSKPSLPPDSQ